MIEFVINGRTMLFSENGQYLELPTLYNIDKLDRLSKWNIFVIDNKVESASQIDDGVVKRFKPVECKGKNIGRKNATTDQEQAIFECYSKWLKKQDQGYTKNVPLKGEKKETLLPMLANKYEDRGLKYLKIPFAVSRKLDGVRMVTKRENDSIKCLTRGGKTLVFLNDIKSEILETMKNLNWDNVLFDGELYSHDLPFNIISGITRQEKTKSPHEHHLQYWIFDIMDNKVSYKERMNRLQIFKDRYSKLFPKGHLRFEFYTVVTKHEEIKDIHDQYVSEGYEGLMTRNLDSTYLFKNRSNDLLKYKSFEDSEFTIVGFKLGKGTEQDAIIFTCVHEGQHFDVRPRGSIEKRVNMGKNGNTFIGKKLTVRYQLDSRNLEETLPRFPVGIVIRDYE